MKRFSTGLALCAGLLTALPAVTSWADDNPEYRSVILIIGDGFDDQHVTMARNYLKGLSGSLILDTLPVRGAVQIETVDTDGKPVYVADSANTATTLATGVVTNMGRVGTGPDDADAVTILERAASAGYRTGIVSSASVTDATPASFMAHVANRGCENPDIILGGQRYGTEYPGCPADALGNGGPGSIAEQIAGAPVDIVLGGGEKHFNVAMPGKAASVIDYASDRSVTVITDPSGLDASYDQRVIGLFADGNLPVRLQGSDGRKAEAADTSLLNKVDPRLGSVVQPEPMSCEPNPEFGNTPTLAKMTKAALDHLARDNDRGLFLMVESASIDKQSHASNPCGSIGEVEQLEEALQAALSFADTHPNTLVLVTADHAQAAQIIPEPSLYDGLPIPLYSPGKVARLRTPEGGLMRINYATTNFRSEEHTGANVPIFGNALAKDWVTPFMRQREVYAAMAGFLGLNDTE